MDFTNIDWQTDTSLTINFLLEDDRYEEFASTLQEKNSNVYDVLKLEGLQFFVEHGDRNISPEREFMNYFMDIDTIASDFGECLYDNRYEALNPSE